MGRLERGLVIMCLASHATFADTDLPPSGRSRFDEFVGTASVPFPFSRLMAGLKSRIESDPGGLPSVKVTLIPQGRSLQRMAAAPDFFAFPRVVLAVDSAARLGFAPLQDRLFIGYQEKAAILEVISYNETLGRFEFQVVHDYQSGAKPLVRYASRALCMSCHQNAAPIFSRPLWSETPANPAIAERLRATRRNYYGIKISGTDIAYFIDAATQRANLFSVWQTVWRDGCGAGTTGAACRREWFDAALSYALSGRLPANRLPILQARWTQQWPRGLAIPNPDIPNRDPLSADVLSLAADPLTHRAPLEIWTTPDPERLIAGLASLFNPADIVRVRDAMQDKPLPTYRFDDLATSAAAFDSGVWLARIVQTLNPAAAPLRHPQPALPSMQTTNSEPARTRFEQTCGQCHRSTERFPPNFLAGDATAQNQRIDQCAARIFYRLTMNTLPEAQRGKTPMPPPSILATRGLTPQSWAHSPLLAELLADVRQRLVRRGTSPDAVMRTPYERLPDCLPLSQPH
jgi:mono/diheme cytochrome c family protein